MSSVTETTISALGKQGEFPAGCSPLRAGEALGLEIKHLSEDFRTLEIVQKAKRGIIQPHLKTENGERRVDLCTQLAKMLREYVGDRTSGLLFCTSTGKQLLQSNTLEDSLHPILRDIKHAKGAFNIFRRFRITHLETSDCPAVLEHFWSGHAHTHVSERYKKLLTQRDYRLEWADRIGLGFELPDVLLQDAATWATRDNYPISQVSLSCCRINVFRGGESLRRIQLIRRDLACFAPSFQPF